MQHEAKKLVSELREYIEMATAEDDDCSLFIAAAEWIERHATPQTQATHGEGEAVAWVGSLALDAISRGWSVPIFGSAAACLEDAQRGGAGRPMPLYTHPAPSPTAPALANKLIELAEVIEAHRWNASWSDFARQAAAALSGVAAQGDSALQRAIDHVRKLVGQRSKEECDTVRGWLDVVELVAHRDFASAQGDGEARVSEDAKELAEWRELAEAVLLMPITPRKLWPNNWSQTVAMVALALYKSLGVADQEKNHV